MFGSEIFDGSLWWIFPLLMIVLCFLMMRGRIGSMCGFGRHDSDSHTTNSSDSAQDILDRRYALGEIDKEEYVEKKGDLTRAS
jgi:putative membrane protein